MHQRVWHVGWAARAAGAADAAAWGRRHARPAGSCMWQFRGKVWAAREGQAGSPRGKSFRSLSRTPLFSGSVQLAEHTDTLLQQFEEQERQGECIPQLPPICCPWRLVLPSKPKGGVNNQSVHLTQRAMPDSREISALQAGRTWQGDPRCCGASIDPDRLFPSAHHLTDTHQALQTLLVGLQQQ